MIMIAGLIITLFVAALSYFITCGIVYLITLCFGWTFSWLIASGIWLIMILLRSIFCK